MNVIQEIASSNDTFEIDSEELHRCNGCNKDKICLIIAPYYHSTQICLDCLEQVIKEFHEIVGENE